MENEIETNPIQPKPKFADWLELVAYPVLGLGSALTIGMIIMLIVLVPLALTFMNGSSNPLSFLYSTKMTSTPGIQAGFIAFMAIIEVSMILPVFFLGFSLKRFSWESFGLSKLKIKWQWVVESIAVVVVVNGIEMLVEYLQKVMNFKLPQFAPNNLDLLIPKNNSIWLFFVFLISIGIIGPICEEILFRGAIYGWFRRYYKPWVGIIISSAIFGILHYETLTRLLFALSIGVYMAWMYEREKTLAAPITLHILNNSIVVALMFFAPNLGSV